MYLQSSQHLYPISVEMRQDLMLAVLNGDVVDHGHAFQAVNTAGGHDGHPRDLPHKGLDERLMVAGTHLVVVGEDRKKQPFHPLRTRAASIASGSMGVLEDPGSPMLGLSLMDKEASATGRQTI